MDGDVEKNVKIFDNFPAYPCLELDMSMHRVEAGFMRHLNHNHNMLPAIANTI